MQTSTKFGLSGLAVVALSFCITNLVVQFVVLTIGGTFLAVAQTIKDKEAKA